MKNKITITLEDLFNLPSAELINPDNLKDIKNVSIDSKNIGANCLFIAIKGNNLDGHSFINDAVKNGAVAVMINKEKLDELNDLNIPVITVDNTTVALKQVAIIWRHKLFCKVFAITGSAGKTTTKEIVAALLSAKYKVNKTLVNNNNHIGVPLTVLSTTEKHDVLVLELGTNHFGEIAYTAEVAKPDFAVITNIGDSHLEFFKERKGVLKEKKELFEAAKDNNGVIFINNDDPYLKRIAAKYPNHVSYGFLTGAQVRGEILDYTNDGRPIVKVKYKDVEFSVDVPLYGEQAAINFLSAASMCLYAGMTAREIIRGTKKIENASGRFNVFTLENKIVIDDTYNANPSSMSYAIKVLGRFKKYERKIAVLGDMFELGTKAEQYHKALYKDLRKAKINEVYSIGPLMKSLHQLIKGNVIKSKHFASRSQLRKFLEDKDFSQSVILVKGSRGMKMEEFVSLINK